MTIETKYNIGDKVWFMHKNKVKSATIIKVNIFVERDINSTCVSKSVQYSLYDLPYHYIENYLYPTKEELLNSL